MGALSTRAHTVWTKLQNNLFLFQEVGMLNAVPTAGIGFQSADSSKAADEKRAVVRMDFSCYNLEVTREIKRQL